MKQQPIILPAGKKRELSTQFGALCYRVQAGRIQILLIKSRGRKRWIVPKGWPMNKSTPAEAAAGEAFEEAGVQGDVNGHCLGIYSYTKEMEGDDLPCIVALFAIKVRILHLDYPEKAERKRKWFSAKKAASLVDSPELAQIIKSFDPKLLIR